VPNGLSQPDLKDGTPNAERNAGLNESPTTHVRSGLFGAAANTMHAIDATGDLSR
jgi:hypothetical protein